MHPETGGQGLENTRWSVKAFHSFPHENAQPIKGKILRMPPRTYESLGLVCHTSLQIYLSTCL